MAQSYRFGKNTLKRLLGKEIEIAEEAIAGNVMSHVTASSTGYCYRCLEHDG
jgi:hypothetical protein